MTPDETKIRSIVEDWAKMVRAKDLDGVLANHTDDIVMFDVPMPLQSRHRVNEIKRRRSAKVAPAFPRNSQLLRSVVRWLEGANVSRKFAGEFRSLDGLSIFNSGR